MPPLPLRIWPAWASVRHLEGFANQLRFGGHGLDRGRRHSSSLTRGRRRSGGGDGFRRPLGQLVLGPSAPSSIAPAAPPSARPSRWRASAAEPSRNSSEWPGSWWKSTVRSAPVRWAKASECESAEWPQPTWSGYSASVYWPSWISRTVFSARAKPEIQSSVERLEVGAERRLVVGDVGERGVAVVDPVAEGRPAVGDRGGADPRRADLPLGLRAAAEGDVAGQLAHLDRRERRRDVAGDAVAQRGLGRGRAPDHDLGLRPEGGGEEDQALDVVEVEVGEEDVQPGRLVAERRGRGCGCRCRRRGRASSRRRGSRRRRRCCRRSGSSPARGRGSIRASPRA